MLEKMMSSLTSCAVSSTYQTVSYSQSVFSYFFYNVRISVNPHIMYLWQDLKYYNTSFSLSLPLFEGRGNNEENWNEPTILKSNTKMAPWKLGAQKVLTLNGKPENPTLGISPREYLVWILRQSCGSVWK